MLTPSSSFIGPRPLVDTVNVEAVLSKCGYSYPVDWSFGGQYELTEGEWALADWYNMSISKPSWSDILDAWAIVRVRKDVALPGDVKWSHEGADHGRWLLWTERRLLLTEDYPLLYARIGDEFAGMDTDSGEFRLGPVGVMPISEDGTIEISHPYYGFNMFINVGTDFYDND